MKRRKGNVQKDGFVISDAGIWWKQEKENQVDQKGVCDEVKYESESEPIEDHYDNFWYWEKAKSPHKVN